jgi:2-polyprenyl-3-methyl-5-hydroxy-6-metoxy-1,4-benzoquinol methylase
VDSLDDILVDRDLGDLLDIACGGGRFARFLVDGSAACRSVLGIDIKENLGEEFVAHLRQGGVTQVRFVAQPIADFLAAGDGTAFDTVSVANALHHIEDVVEVLARLRGTLRAGGTVIVQEMHGDGLTAAQETQRDLHALLAELHSAQGEHHRAVFTTAEMETLLGTAGLAIAHRFHAANDDRADPAAASPMLGRISEAVARLWPDGPPAEIVTRRDALFERAQRTGVGRPPQWTLVCRFA